MLPGVSAIAAAPDWATSMTAIGTVALAAVTVGAIIITIVITKQDRQRADSQLVTERRRTQDSEQLGEAHAVQVLLRERRVEPEDTVWGTAVSVDSQARILAAIVINHGKYSIDRLQAKLNLRERPLQPFISCVRVPDTRKLDEELKAGTNAVIDADSLQMDLLTPWDLGMRFESEILDRTQIPLSYPIVRWRDRWGQHWERTASQIRQISENEPWEL